MWTALFGAGAIAAAFERAPSEIDGGGVVLPGESADDPGSTAAAGAVAVRPISWASPVAKLSPA